MVKEAAMVPVRELSTEELMNLKDMTSIRPLGLNDFKSSLKINAPSVSTGTITEFDDWRKSKG